MRKVHIYLIDTRKLTFNEIVSLCSLNEEDVSSLSKYKVLDVKKEKAVSLYFRKKYIGEVSITEYGKPISSNIFFNISHSKGVVVLATCLDRDIGVDVEIIRESHDDLARYISNDYEYSQIKTEIDFYSVWTSKESIVKCLGTGLKNDIKSIPSLPFDGAKEYKGVTYFSKIKRIGDVIISTTIRGNEDFDIELTLEGISHE